MSAFGGGEKCAHFHLLCLPVASDAVCNFSSIFFQVMVMAYQQVAASSVRADE